MLLCSREEITDLTLVVVAESGKVFLVAETIPIYVHEGFFLCLAVHSISWKEEAFSIMRQTVLWLAVVEYLRG